MDGQTIAPDSAEAKMKIKFSLLNFMFISKCWPISLITEALHATIVFKLSIIFTTGLHPSSIFSSPR